MNAKEGLSRIGKLCSAASWAMLLLGVVLSSVLLFGSKTDWGFFLVCAAVVCAFFCAMQGTVWILDGFAGNKAGQSNLFWPCRRYRRQVQAIGQAEESAASVVADPVVDPVVGPAVASRAGLTVDSSANPGIDAAAEPSFRIPIEATVDSTKQTTGSRGGIEPRGVHGWLFLLVLSLLVLSPLFGLALTAQNLAEAQRMFPSLQAAPQWQDYMAASWIVAWLLAGVVSFSGYRLFKVHQPESVNMAITVLWAGPVLSIILDGLLANHFLQVSFNDALSPDLLADAARGLLAAGVWTFYLKLSKRVRNTYYAEYPNSPAGSLAIRTEPTL